MSPLSQKKELPELPKYERRNTLAPDIRVRRASIFETRRKSLFHDNTLILSNTLKKTQKGNSTKKDWPQKIVFQTLKRWFSNLFLQVILEIFFLEMGQMCGSLLIKLSGK